MGCPLLCCPLWHRAPILASGAAVRLVGASSRMAGSFQSGGEQSRASANGCASSLLRRGPPPGPRQRTPLPNSGHHVPAWRRLRHRPHLRTGRRLGQERPRLGHVRSRLSAESRGPGWPKHHPTLRAWRGYPGLYPGHTAHRSGRVSNRPASPQVRAVSVYGWCLVGPLGLHVDRRKAVFGHARGQPALLAASPENVGETGGPDLDGGPPADRTTSAPGGSLLLPPQ